MRWVGFGVLTILLALLALAEFGRYRRANTSGRDLPYPRRRLARRLTIAVLIGLILAGLVLKPSDLGARGNLVWYGLSLILTLAALGLALRDLHETSVAVVREHEEFSRQADQHLRRTLPTLIAAARRKKKGGP